MNVLEIVWKRKFQFSTSSDQPFWKYGYVPIWERWWNSVSKQPYLTSPWREMHMARPAQLKSIHDLKKSAYSQLQQLTWNMMHAGWLRIAIPCTIPHASYNFVQHHVAHFHTPYLFPMRTLGKALLLLVFSPSTCCLLRGLLGENWDITNGDEDLTNCENDEYEVRALLRWRLFRIFRKTRVLLCGEWHWFRPKPPGHRLPPRQRKRLPTLFPAFPKTSTELWKACAYPIARRTEPTSKLPTFSKNTSKYRYQQQRQRSHFGHVNRSRQSGSLILVTDWNALPSTASSVTISTVRSRTSLWPDCLIETLNWKFWPAPMQRTKNSHASSKLLNEKNEQSSALVNWRQPHSVVDCKSCFLCYADQQDQQVLTSVPCLPW